MYTFIARRLLQMIPTLIIISIISFIIIQLPPGDIVTNMLLQMEQSGYATDAQIEALRVRYGLNQPMYIRYFRWITGFIKGNFGYSMSWGKPVAEIVGERLSLTVILSLGSMIFVWVVALPIGFYSAVKQYSIGDYIFTFIGFLGLAIPNFMLALVLMFLSYKYFGSSPGGLFSPEYMRASWSIYKFLDLLRHMIIPVIVIGTAGTAGTIRTLRANLLDELRKPYVTTARSKGLKELRLLLKYPFRIAINPMMSTIGWLLPRLIGGSMIVSVVLSLPTTGPLYLQALREQDMYLAGFFVLTLATLTIIGTLISDILLAIVDPRIRYE